MARKRYDGKVQLDLKKKLWYLPGEGRNFDLNWLLKAHCHDGNKSLTVYIAFLWPSICTCIYLVMLNGKNNLLSVPNNSHTTKIPLNVKTIVVLCE